jgi:hypothetical protein
MNMTSHGLPIEQRKNGAIGSPIAPISARRGPASRRLGTDLWRRMACECEAMAEDLLCAGRVIPEEIVAMLAETLPILDDIVAEPAGELGPRAAVRHRAASGETWADPAEAASRPLDAVAIARLSKVHGALAVLSAPSTPEAVLLLREERQRRSWAYVFGPLPIVRQMLVLALLSLIVLIAASLQPDVNSENMRKSFLDLTGLPLLMTEIFLLSAASLGTCFQNLQQMNFYISAGTYDPRFQSSYWTRWMMGVISGFLLAELLHDVLFVPGSPVGSITGAGGAGGAVSAVSPIATPMLALLGGYSVDLVHGILSQIVKMLGSFFRTPAAGSGETRAAGETPAPPARP